MTLAEITKPSAEAVISRSEAEAHDVHAYALKEIAVLEHMLAELKARINARKQARDAATRAYIEAVDEAIRSSRGMEDAVTRLTEAVDQT